MFGFGAFGEAPFGGIPDGAIVITAAAALAAQSAEIAGAAEADVDVNGSLEAQDAVIDGAVLNPVTEADGALAAAAAIMDGYVRRNMTAEFDLEGSATLEFVGTTSFIDLVESGQGEFAFSAEIRLRSL